MKISLTVFSILAVCAALYGCGYNRLQQLEENALRAWGDVESTLQRRADLVSNLVEAVRGYAAHEQRTLTAVIRARAEASAVTVSGGDLSDLRRLQEAQDALSAALSRLLAVVEGYPELQSSASFLDLQTQLAGTENRIAVARRRYNQAVEQFNAAIRKFPYNLTNHFLLQLERKAYFQMEAGAGAVPSTAF